MSGRGLDAPLAEQIERLNKSIHNRDRRRNQDRKQSLARAERSNDPYDSRAQRVPKNDTGGLALAPAAAANAAVASAAALSGPKALRCDLCNATFRGEPAMQQHLAGPIHRKAMARAEAERLRDERLGEYSGAAAAAVAAAAWANEDVRAIMSERAANRGGHRGGRGGGPASNRGGGRAGGRQPGPPGPGLPQKRGQAPEVKVAPGPSHQDAIAAARRTTQPLTIGGWVPPTIINAPDASAPEPPPKKPRIAVGVPPVKAALVSAKPHLPQQPESDAGSSPVDSPGPEEGLGALVGYGQSSASDDDSNALSEEPGPNDRAAPVFRYF